MSTFLGIWAHPDDEVFVSGGWMAAAARRGDRVVTIHMTEGEAGLNFREPSQPEVLAPIRRRELNASLDILGVGERYCFEYPDGRLVDVPAREATARIHKALVDIRPEVIVTFGPDGFTGHPDHRTLSAWVSGAFRIWNDPTAQLFHSAISSRWKDSFVARLNEFDIFWPGFPVPAPGADFAVSLDDRVVEIKIDALRAHATQMAPLFDTYGEEFMRALAAEEQFILAEVSRLPLRSPVRACMGYKGLRGAYARRSSSR